MNDSMSKELLQYILTLTTESPHLTNVEGRTYLTNRGEMKEIKQIRITPLKTTTLTGLIDYMMMPEGQTPLEWIIHVESHKRVVLTAHPYGVDNVRDQYVIAEIDAPGFPTDKFHDAESFMIMAMARLYETEGKKALLQFISDINDVDEQRVKDNGVGQTITAKSGIQTLDTVPVPNPVELAPFRTFPDVSQPISPFILRVKKGPEIGIFEADGGAWKSDAIQIIANHLKMRLAEYSDRPFYIIA